jgi:hypothetical protein
MGQNVLGKLNFYIFNLLIKILNNKDVFSKIINFLAKNILFKINLMIEENLIYKDIHF